MNTTKGVLTYCFAVAGLSITELTGAEFSNLSFESFSTNNLSGISPDGRGIGAPERLIMPWQLEYVYSSEAQKPSFMGYNYSIFDFIALVHDASYFWGPFPLEGRYGFIANPGPVGKLGLGHHQIFQSGLVPDSALSLRFLAFGDPWAVFINGAEVPLIGYDTPLAPYEGREILGDISAFAGQEVELKFVTRSVNFGYNGLDSIRFSPEAVPEPGAAGLLALGGLAWLLAGRRRSARHTLRA